MSEELSRTPTLPPPSPAELHTDDAPLKAHGAPSTDNNNTLLDHKPRDLPLPPSKARPLSSTPSPSAAMPLARSGTLSWQQRPTSRGSTLRGRPLSMLASENNAAESPRASAEREASHDDNISRSQIAQSLGSRDPSWFKQTQDRGLGSAAFRKNQVEDTSDTASTTSSMRLPGMSRESTAEPEGRMSPPPESMRSISPTMEGSLRGTSSRGHKYSSSASNSSLRGTRSPLPIMNSQRFEPPSSDTISSGGDDDSSTTRSLAMSPSQGRISPERMERPASPTKGLGGFVQSAMLKRSDSVNKRWSAQVGPGLSRGNSTASNISGYGGSRYPVGGITPLMESRQNSTSREGSPASSSRPGSSHSNMTITHKEKENDRPGTITSSTNSKPESLLDEKLDTLNTRGSELSSPPPEPVMSPPASPSKKWSPTKSSWLENAINKPDSPKFRSAASSQPPWMAEINRAKQQKGSVDLGKSSNFKEVSIGGLVRSPPPGAGYKVPTIGGFSSGFSAGLASKSRNGSIDSNIQRKDSSDTMTAQDTPETKSPTRSPQVNQPSAETEPIEIKSGPPASTKPTVPPIAVRKSPPPDSRAISPPATKPKPETPPKRDFRSDLKPKQSPGGVKTKEEPEFKNVFGNLKRTQTKNYVAPDELKDNIMRGKNGLVQTGGPKKTERRDELKESILQKKQGMIAPSASTRITSASSKIPGQSTPEAIAKRNRLTRSESMQSNASVEADKPSKPEALAKLQHLREKPPATSTEKQSVAPHTAQNESGGPKAALGGNFTASLAGMLQRGPSPMAGTPALAQSTDDKPRTPFVANRSEQDSPSEGPQLTHATKARARGPKRRLPTASKKEEPAIMVPMESKFVPKTSKAETEAPAAINVPKSRSSTLSPTRLESRPLSNITGNNNSNRKPSQPTSPRKPSTTISQSIDSRSLSPGIKVANEDIQPKSSPPVKQKPIISPKDANKRQSSNPTPAAIPDTPLKRPHTQEPQTILLNGEETRNGDTTEPHSTISSVKGAAANWGQPPKATHSARARSPVKLPTRKEEEDALAEAGLGPKEQVGLGIRTPVKESQPSPTAPSPKSPPLPAKKPPSIAIRIASSNLLPQATPEPQLSPAFRTSKVDGFLSEIFDEPPTSRSKISIDTQAILDCRSSPNASQKIKTLRKQIFEITDNGKTVPVPSHQEHILFEGSLYLCTHVFGNHAGQRTTEVYLWCGDAVPTSAAEDAHLFAKKFAKDNNGRLVILKQGKETTNFFQALGGIVITRRGSSSKAGSPSDSSATYVLCGRLHVGQIAFDEVDFAPQSLCKGFPYIVSTPGGKLYLWKGSGSGADELGCARLIGMDLGLSGEIEEIDDGQEPDAFWDVFPRGRRDVSFGQGQHWHTKPFCEKYTNRLFNVNVEAPRPKSASSFIQGAMQWGRRGSAPATDAETPKSAQIREVVPFAQSDLLEEGVFVLDAFFEIFV